MTRQIFTILIMLGGIGLFAQGSEQPFRKANTITLYTQNSDSLNFKAFQRQLLKFDYFIDKTDPELLVVTTDFHALKKRPGWSYSYRYKILFMDGNIIIKPFWQSGVSIGFYSGGIGAQSTIKEIRWKYTTARSNVNTMIHNETLEMLTDYCDCKIIYGQQ